MQQLASVLILVSAASSSSSGSRLQEQIASYLPASIVSMQPLVGASIYSSYFDFTKRLSTVVCYCVYVRYLFWALLKNSL